MHESLYEGLNFDSVQEYIEWLQSTRQKKQRGHPLKGGSSEKTPPRAKK